MTATDISPTPLCWCQTLLSSPAVPAEQSLWVISQKHWEIKNSKTVWCLLSASAVLCLMMCLWLMCLCVSGPSVPPVWCVSTGCTERLPAGAALPALLLQSMLGAALHCPGQRWHRSGWVVRVCVCVKSSKLVLECMSHTSFDVISRVCVCVCLCARARACVCVCVSSGFHQFQPLIPFEDNFRLCSH